MKPGALIFLVVVWSVVLVMNVFCFKRLLSLPPQHHPHPDDE